MSSPVSLTIILSSLTHDAHVWLQHIWTTYIACYPEWLIFTLGNCLVLFLTMFGGVAIYTLFDLSGIFDEYKLVYGKKESTRKRPSNELMWKCGLDTVQNFFTVVIPLQLIGAPFLYLRGISIHDPIPSFGSMLLQIFAFLCIEDFFGYWIHRWMHTPWAFQHIHKKHHTIKEPFALSNLYMHPGEITNMGLAVAIGPMLYGPHLLVFWLWIGYRSFDAVGQHSGIEVPFDPRRLIGLGARHHDLHHHYLNKNYCFSFPWWDQFWGTQADK